MTKTSLSFIPALSTPRNLFREVLSAGMNDKLVLVMHESLWVFPRNYDRELHEYFRIILTWDPRMVDGKKYHRFYIPNPTTFPPVSSAAFGQRKLLMDISGYKFSNHPLELYSERRRLARFFE